MIELLLAAKGAVPKDPHYRYTTLHLTGQQSNTSQQNNLFLDSGAAFTATIAGTTMTVVSIAAGTLRVGHSIYIAGVALGITITALGNGTGGTGTYTVSASQNVTNATAMTSGFNITRNPASGPNAPTQGTFSPFSQTGWGNYFGGSGNYLKVADGTALDLPGDFTLEGWFYFSSLSSNNGIIGYGSEAASQNGFSLYWAASSVNKLRIWSNGATLLTGTTTLSANTWNHIAIVRSGSGSNNLTVYVNGAVDQTATNTTSFTGVAALGMGIGVNYDGTFYNPFTGYASNIRLVKGQALATGAFTPPTSPVSTSSVGWTGANAAASLTGTVSVLTCQSNRFVDNSSSPLAITVTGSPSVQAFSPFNPTASWSAATYGGSGYFDGSGDYLTVADNTALEVPTQDFTIEAWVYLTSLPSSGAGYTVIQKGRTGTSDFEYSFEIENNAGNMRLLCRTSSDGASLTTAYGNTISLAANTWYHVAVTRTTTTASFWFGGVAAGSGTVNSTTYTGAATVGLFANNAGSSPLVGYASNFRLVKGVAVYTGAFTPPTAPLTAITNTSLLLNFTNAGIYDATSKNDLETVGNAQISNTIAKFGSTSMYFDGTGDYLTSNPATTDMYAFGSGDFTIEMWIRWNSLIGIQVFYDQRPLAGGVYPTLYMSGTTLIYYTNSANRITGSTLSTGQWYHIAIARSGTSTKLFVDGVQSGSTYTDSNVYLNAALRPFIGGDGTNIGAGINAYMQDVRVTKGYARYTANFTPPTAAFPTL